MIKTLFILSDTYLDYVTPEVFEDIGKSTKLVLVVHHQEVVDDQIAGFMHEVHRVDGDCSATLRPELDYPQTAALIREEIFRLGSAEWVALFCQQEDNLMLAARLREAFSIPGDRPELVCRFRDKLIMKQTVSQHLPGSVPLHRVFDQQWFRKDCGGYYRHLCALLGKRLVIKPTSGAGSVNVAIVDSFADFAAFADLLAGQAYEFQYEVDSFIDGVMYQCDSLIVAGEVKFASVLQLGCSNYEFVQGQPLTVTPAIDAGLRQQIEAFNHQVISALGLTDGVTHHELFVDPGSGKITFLEIAMRIPGAMIVPFHNANSGVNLMDASLCLATDKRALSGLQVQHRNDRFAALLPLGEGRVRSLHAPEIESDYHIDWYVMPGTVVESTSTVQDRAGVLWVHNPDPVILQRDFLSLQSYRAAVCS